MLYCLSRIFFIIVTIILLPACRNNKTVSFAPVKLPEFKKQPVIRVTQAGHLRFRKSYAGHDKMTPKELEEMNKALPGLGYGEDSLLLKKFQQAGFAKEDLLLVNKINLDTATRFVLQAPGLDELKGDIRFLLNGDYRITVSGGGGRAVFRLHLSGFEFMYKLYDVIPGGYPELILLDGYYIMNGDNYDFSIYEIKSIRPGRM